MVHGIRRSSKSRNVSRSSRNVTRVVGRTDPRRHGDRLAQEKFEVMRHLYTVIIVIIIKNKDNVMILALSAE
jgi:hypothetical protein